MINYKSLFDQWPWPLPSRPSSGNGLRASKIRSHTDITLNALPNTLVSVIKECVAGIQYSTLPRTSQDIDYHRLAISNIYVQLQITIQYRFSGSIRKTPNQNHHQLVNKIIINIIILQHLFTGSINSHACLTVNLVAVKKLLYSYKNHIRDTKNSTQLSEIKSRSVDNIRKLSILFPRQ